MARVQFASNSLRFVAQSRTKHFVPKIIVVPLSCIALGKVTSAWGNVLFLPKSQRWSQINCFLLLFHLNFQVYWSSSPACHIQEDATVSAAAAFATGGGRNRPKTATATI